VPTSSLQRAVEAVDAQSDDLIALRRDLHAHPELAWQEERTTGLVAAHLEKVGVEVKLLPKSGLIAELGSGEAEGPLIALRADLDALPVDDLGDKEWISTVDGVAHACGHDVHTASLVGAGIALLEAHRHSPLRGRVRLLFQPAEEVMPGGALEVIAAGALDRVSQVYGLHCDPSIDVGQVGLRVGPLTGAADALTVRLTGRGGHTSRPHLTEDLTYALGKLVTELTGTLSRRLDPRAGASLVWGVVRAGSAKNVIPASGEAAGTLRMLDALAWADAEDLVRGLVEQILAPYGVQAEITYVRGVPPVVNKAGATALLGRAVSDVLGKEQVVTTPQSLGGEDFAWYLESVPGAMGRLGTRVPGGTTYDLHQGDLQIDERAIAIGAKVLAAAVLTTCEAAAED
jgi:amidohydrolase